MDFFKVWFERPKKRDRDHPIVKLAYSILPPMHTPLLITVEKPMPWDESGDHKILVVTVPPYYQVMHKLHRYITPPEMVKSIRSSNIWVEITYITINDYINQMLEGNVRLNYQTSPKATKPMYTAQWRLGPMFRRLRTYILSRETFYRGITNLRKKPIPVSHSKMSEWAFEIAFFRYWGKEGRIASDVLIASNIDHHQDFDDVIFGRYEMMNVDDFTVHATNQIEKLFRVKRGVNRLRQNTDFSYIIGTVYQLHSVYAKD